MRLRDRELLLIAVACLVTYLSVVDVPPNVRVVAARAAAALGHVSAAEHQLLAAVGGGVPAASDPSMTRALCELAALYRRQGRWEQAKIALERALEIQQRSEGREAPGLVPVLRALADLHQTRGRLAEAITLRRRCIAVLEKSVGPQHLLVAAELERLAKPERDLARFDEAEALFRRALAIREELLEPGHPDVTRNLVQLGSLFRIRGDLQRADLYLTRALEQAEEQGSGVALASARNELGLLRGAQGRPAEAELLLGQALESLPSDGQGHEMQRAAVLNNLGSIDEQEGRLEEALAHYRKALREMAALPPEHPYRGALHNNVAVAHEERREYDEAVSYLESALNILGNSLPSDHPLVASTADHLAALRRQRLAANR